MIHGSNGIIRADLLGALSSPARRTGGSGLERLSRLNRFERLLSASTQAYEQRPNEASRGLTILDYMADPVRAAFFPKPPPAGDPNGPREAVPSVSETEKEQRPSGIGPDNGAPAQPAVKSDRVARNLPADRQNTGRETTDRQEIDHSIRKAASRYRLPEALIKGVIRAESDFRSDAVSPAGACGLMQLMPGTAEELGVDDPFNIDANIDGGSRYLRKMLDLFEGDVKQALMAYNAGPGTVRRYEGNVPYQETRQYVDRVIRFSGVDTTLS